MSGLITFKGGSQLHQVQLKLIVLFDVSQTRSCVLQISSKHVHELLKEYLKSFLSLSDCGVFCFQEHLWDLLVVDLFGV